MIEQSYGSGLHAFRQSVVAAMRKVKLTTLKEGCSHEQVVPEASYAPWRDDQDFLAIYERVRTHTLVDVYRCFELWQLTRQLKTLRGDLLEVGVWRGGTSAIVGKAARIAGDTSRLWIADTFSGVTKADSRADTNYRGGEHADTSEAIVRQLLTSADISDFTILSGIFPDETGCEMDTATIKLCHIDVDAYASARDVFSWVWPRMACGGVVVFDDYGFWGCEGVTSAVNELMAQGTIVVHNLNGHALIFKIFADG